MFRGGPTRTGVYETEGVEAEPSVLWRFATSGRVLASPAVIDGRAYIGSDDGALYAIDIATGDEAWRFETGASVASDVTVDRGVAYIGSFDQTLYAVDVESGLALWQIDGRGWFWGSPLIVDDIVYVADLDGQVRALICDGLQCGCSNCAGHGCHFTFNRQ